MAAPPTQTLTNLHGTYHLSKPLSTPSAIPTVLQIQGVSTLLRHTIASAAVILAITQPSPDTYHIKQHAISALVPGTTERYILDNSWRENHDPFFGDMRGRSRWIEREEVEREYPDLVGEWEEAESSGSGKGEDGEEGKGANEGSLIFAEGGRRDGGWTAERSGGLRLWAGGGGMCSG